METGFSVLRPQLCALLCLALLGGVPSSRLALSQNLPIDFDGLKALGEKPAGEIGNTNLLSLAQIDDAVRGGSKDGLSVDFSHVRKLLDGGDIDPATIHGKVYYGPYPFESSEVRFAYQRFRGSVNITGGKATLRVGTLFISKYNSERWTDRGRLAIRVRLFSARAEADRDLGTYETLVAFKEQGGLFLRVPSFAEGPFVNLVHSGVTGSAVISFVTQDIQRARVIVTSAGGSTREFPSERAALRHEVTVTGLSADEPSTYRVVFGEVSTRDFPLLGAPAKGVHGVRFGYFGDTRGGVGGGLSSFMGVNRDTLERISHSAYPEGARFLLVGGDLVNGYTGSREDFDAQLWAWKYSLTSFWNERPIYAAMGNHETLLRQFGDVKVDRFPYGTDSAEAVFADTFVHPRNGPVPSDSRRPQYDENVYSFQYGCVRAIAFNNNYWVSYDSETYGGAPEGYLLPDQLDWIIRALDDAEADPTVKYVVLFAQEPIFPNGGHVADSMWHDGDNRVRAQVFRDGKVLPENDGMLVVRNRLVRAVSEHRKVAAVLSSDEHAYHRLLVGPQVPLGDIDRDDRNKNGKIDLVAGEECSPLPSLRFRTWYIVGGGGGAPYYAEEETPWNLHWRARPAPPGASSGFYYSSQENIIIFDAKETTISMRVLNPRGELIDRITDLMAVKAGG